MRYHWAAISTLDSTRHITHTHQGQHWKQQLHTPTLASPLETRFCCHCCCYWSSQCILYQPHFTDLLDLDSQSQLNACVCQTHVTCLPSNSIRLEKASFWRFQFYRKQALPPTTSQKVESPPKTEEENRSEENWRISPEVRRGEGTNVYYNRTGQIKTLRNLN